MANKPLRILSICTSDTAGGAARAAVRIQEAVQVQGVESRMFVKDKKSNRADVIALAEFVPKSKMCRLFDWVATKVKNKIQHARWRKYPHQDKNYKSDLRSTRIYGALQKIDYDVLHLHWVNQRFLDLRELRKVNKPIVWTLHDSWPFCGVCHYFLDCDGYQKECGNCPQLNPSACRDECSASSPSEDLSHTIWAKKKQYYAGLNLHIVSPSQWLADCARKSSLFRGLDIRVIPNPIDTNIFSPAGQIAAGSRDLQKRFAKPFLLYGAVNAATDRIKGFANLLCALQTLEEQGYKGFELVIFGAEDKDLPAEIHTLTIPIRNVGYVHDTDTLVSLYREAAVMVVPSLTENLSCAIMESLSCGTPVVAFAIGGNGDMIEHKVNGYLAKEEDNADLADGIRWVLDNNEDNHLGIAARKKVLRCYTPEVVGKQYKLLYKEITHCKNSQS